jgi:hypothetical protein
LCKVSSGELAFGRVLEIEWLKDGDYAACYAWFLGALYFSM